MNTSNIPRKIPAEYILSAPNNAVKIPLPSDDDIEWAKARSIATPGLGDLDNACQKGQLWRIQYVLDRGTDINNTYGDPLYYAAANSQADAVKLLLANSAVIEEAMKNDKMKPTVKHFIMQCMSELSPWKKTNDHSIMNLRYLNDVENGIYRIQREFNFRSRRITTYTAKNGTELAPMSEFFRDQEVDVEIREAHAELVKQGGSPPGLDTVLSGAHDKGKVARLAIRGKM